VEDGEGGNNIDRASGVEREREGGRWGKVERR
jgi:hypothetical protein